MVFIIPSTNKSFKKILIETLSKFKVSLEKATKTGDLTNDLVGEYITKLSQLYDLSHVVEMKNQRENQIQVDYKEYVSIFTSNLKIVAKTISLSDLGFFISLVNFVEHNKNIIMSPNNLKKISKKKEIVEFLQVTNERADNFLKICLNNKFIFKKDFNGVKSTYLFSPSIVKKTVSIDEFNKVFDASVTKKGTSKKIILNISALNNELFKKIKTLQRLSEGKESLGFLVHLLCLMDIENKIYSNNNYTINKYLRIKIKTDKCDKFLTELINNGFVDVDYQKNVITVNPDFARFSSKLYFPTDTCTLFKIPLYY